MNPLFSSRKRADEFDLLLSRTSADALAGDATSERYADLLQVVSTMREVPAPTPRPDFAADLRSRLMIAAESALAPDTSEQSAARRAPAVRRSPRERRIVAAVGGFAIVSATASMAVAAQSALPGDTLYPLKRAIENAQAGVQRDADDRGTTLLGNATGRLDEVDALSRSGDDPQTISVTLQDFVLQATEASELLLDDYASTGHASSIEELRSFTAASMGALTTLRNVIPEDARASLIEATQVINAIDVQAQSLCPACTDLPITQAPVFAQRAIDTLLDGVLAPTPDGVLPAATTSSDSKDKQGKGNKGKQGTGRSGDSAPNQIAPPAQPQVPTDTTDDPILPQGPSGNNGSKGGKKGGGLLDEISITASDDPIGDLLTGTGEVLDDVVDNLGGLGGLGKN